MDRLRQTGLTTKQMMDAPHSAVYIWVNSHIAYPTALARSLGRDDLDIQPPSWLERRRFLGRIMPGIVVDHAVCLTPEEAEALRECLAKIEVSRRAISRVARGQRKS